MDACEDDRAKVYAESRPSPDPSQITPNMSSEPDYSFHHFSAPIKRVAVIGAGPSGCPAAKHLLDQGLEVRVFERQSRSGGVWNWQEYKGLPPTIPSPPPSKGAFEPVLSSRNPDQTIDEKEKWKFCPPNPCYWNLENNVPVPTMEFKDFPYPPGTPNHVPHSTFADYVHRYSAATGVDAITSYNTRVENVRKVGTEYVITLRKLEPQGAKSQLRETIWHEDFDAVVVATGHYNAPLIPRLNGLEAWSARWPENIAHSQAYRRPEDFTNKNVVIVGAGTSGVDIARDIASTARNVYMVGKNRLTGPDDYKKFRNFQRFLVPKTALSVPEIKTFRRPPSGPKGIEAGEIELTDGRVLTDIHEIIFATGYQYSFPFLPDYHRDPTSSSTQSISDSLSRPEPLVTDGKGVLNVYRDSFYIPDPTLAFVGLSINTAAFSFFEYQSIAIARVFGGKARLPNEFRRREAYRQMVQQKGEGRDSHLMGKENERRFVKETVAWLNEEAPIFGASLVEGHTEEWLAHSDKTMSNFFARYGISAEVMQEIQESTARILADKGEVPLEIAETIGETAIGTGPLVTARPIAT